MIILKSWHLTKCWHWINANFARQELSRMIYLYKVKTFTKFYPVFYIFFIPLTLITLMFHIILMFAPTCYFMIAISLSLSTFHETHFFVI